MTTLSYTTAAGQDLSYTYTSSSGSYTATSPGSYTCGGCHQTGHGTASDASRHAKDCTARPAR